MKVLCPTCKKDVEWEGNPTRPFCSERCQLIDLGEWAQEKFGVPAEDQVPRTQDPQQESESEED